MENDLTIAQHQFYITLLRRMVHYEVKSTVTNCHVDNRLDNGYTYTKIKFFVSSHFLGDSRHTIKPKYLVCIKHKSFSVTFLHNRPYVIQALNINNISRGTNFAMRLETVFLLCSSGGGCGFYFVNASFTKFFTPLYSESFWPQNISGLTPLICWRPSRPIVVHGWFTRWTGVL